MTKKNVPRGTQPGQPIPQRDMIALDTLVVDPANPRIHEERNLRDIMNSLHESGQQHPIVVERSTNRILAGNGRYEAARRLGWKKIWCVFSDLSGKEADRYALRDNRTAETSRWAFEKLAEELKRIREASGNITNLGWLSYEMEPLLQADWDSTRRAEENDSGTSEPAAPDHAFIHLTFEQYEPIVRRAIEAVRLRDARPGASMGECLKIIATEWRARRGMAV